MNKETISNSRRKVRFLLLFFFFCALKSERPVQICCVELERVPVSVIAYFAPSKANRYLRWIDCSRACTSCPFSSFCLDLFEIAQRLATLCRRFALICKPHSAIGRRWFFFFFFFFSFFLLSIAQQIGSKPPPSHMKVLSFVRDVRTFEMTPYFAQFAIRGYAPDIPPPHSALNSSFALPPAHSALLPINDINIIFPSNNPPPPPNNINTTHRGPFQVNVERWAKFFAKTI